MVCRGQRGLLHRDSLDGELSLKCHQWTLNPIARRTSYHNYTTTSNKLILFIIVCLLQLHLNHKVKPSPHLVLHVLSRIIRIASIRQSIFRKQPSPEKKFLKIALSAKTSMNATLPLAGFADVKANQGI